MKHLNSQELIARTKSLVAQERSSTLALIEHLAEIQSRMLYAELGYASLWEFATLELGLSEGAAQRRIQAMRLLRAAPEARSALESGRLSLSNAAKVQGFVQAQKKLGHKTDAGKLAAQVESMSQKDCEKALFEIAPEAMPRERDRIVSASSEHELKFVVSAELHEKLQRLKGLLAHAKPEANYAELLEYMTDEVLGRLEKKRGLGDNALPSPTAAAAVKLPAGRRVYLPGVLRRAVWSRSGGRCEIEHTGRRCSSRYRLEIDHIMPLARGGANELRNLRIACRNHNQQLAKKKLG